MFSFFIVFTKIVFVLSIIVLILFKILTKERKIFKNINFLCLLFFTLFLIIIQYLMGISANIILGGYKGTIFSMDGIGFFIILVITSLAIFEPIVLFYFLIKNITFIIKKIRNNKLKI